MMRDDFPVEPRLQRHEGNPIPDGSKTGTIETSDGMRLRFSRWKSARHPGKGTVLILPGRAEFIEKYFETVGELTGRGFGVVCFDWRGQGGSGRMLADHNKGHIEHFDQYLLDLDTVISKVVLPDCQPPYYILGHSTGALVALLAGPALGNRIRRMVLIAPLLQLNNLPISQSKVLKISAFLTLLGLGHNYLDFSGKRPANRSFANNRVTSDTKRFNRTMSLYDKRPGLFLSGPTISWVFAACRAMEQVHQPEHLASIAVPTLMIPAGNDAVVDPLSVQRYGRKMRSGAVTTIFGAKHEILQERDEFRHQFFAAFDAFVPGTEI